MRRLLALTVFVFVATPAMAGELAVVTPNAGANEQPGIAAPTAAPARQMPQSKPDNAEESDSVGEYSFGWGGGCSRKKHKTEALIN